MGFCTRLGLSLVLVISTGSTWAQMLDEKPVPMGGDLVGAWQADSTAIQVYADTSLLAAVSNLSFGGSVSGLLTLEADGTYRADYIVKAEVSAVLFGPINEAFADTTRASGLYTVDSTVLILEQDAGADTLSYTVEGDSLFLIRSVPLGQYEALLASLTSDLPVAVLGLERSGGGGDEPGDLTADFDGDGDVDFGDFLGFASRYGKMAGEAGFDSAYDLNGNGTIDFLDFLQLARQYGRTS